MAALNVDIDAELKLAVDLACKNRRVTLKAASAQALATWLGAPVQVQVPIVQADYAQHPAHDAVQFILDNGTASEVDSATFTIQSMREAVRSRQGKKASRRKTG